MDLDFFNAKLQVTLEKEYTEEQIELYKDLTHPTISFSMPGTGKTQTVVAGLLCTELVHKIPGNNICALSFTNKATLELKNRHMDACKKMHIKQLINFSTISSMCSQILKKNYRLLGFNSLTVKDNENYGSKAKYIKEEAAANNIKLSPYKIRSVISAISTLNASLIFDRQHVESRYCFIKTGLSFEDFTYLRLSLYNLNKALQVVQVSDISLYTLELLIKRPELVESLRKQNKVMIIDEFQDLSLVQLKLASLMCESLSAVGDLNQQIYAFNGACHEIVEEYLKLYPNARKVNLTRSFRCGEAIADYATARIILNDPTAMAFKGVKKESKVEISAGLDIPKIANSLQVDFVENRNHFTRDVMFLFRNNFSVIPVVEELFKRDLPMMVSKYVPAHQIPVVSELCAIVELCRNPNIPSNVAILNKFFPEFQHYKNVEDNPLYKLMVNTGQSIFDIAYTYAEPDTAMQCMKVIMQVNRLLENNAPVRDIFNTIYPVFDAMYFSENSYLYEQEPTYYCSLVKSLTQTKTYSMFISDEIDKCLKIADWQGLNIGIKCYTMHAAKGTEADDVYILDASEGIMPNNNKLEEVIKSGCYLDAARDIRNERSLVYVACTRAKDNLFISYSGSLSKLFTDENDFSTYDDIYKRALIKYDDVSAFLEFTRED